MCILVEAVSVPTGPSRRQILKANAAVGVAAEWEGQDLRGKKDQMARKGNA